MDAYGSQPRQMAPRIASKLQSIPRQQLTCAAEDVQPQVLTELRKAPWDCARCFAQGEVGRFRCRQFLGPTQTTTKTYEDDDEGDYCEVVLVSLFTAPAAAAAAAAVVLFCRCYCCGDGGNATKTES